MSSFTLNDEEAKALYDKLDYDLKAKMTIEQYKMVIVKLIEEEEKEKEEKEKYKDVDDHEVEKDPVKLYTEYKKLNDALIVAKSEADIKAIYNKTITDIKVKLSHEDKDMILAYYKAIYAVEEEKYDDNDNDNNNDNNKEVYTEEYMMNPINLIKLTAENKKLKETVTLQLDKIATYNKMIISINAKLSPEEKEIIFAYYENEYEYEYEYEYNDNEDENENDEITMTNIEIMEAKIKIIAWLINID